MKKRNDRAPRKVAVIESTLALQFKNPLLARIWGSPTTPTARPLDTRCLSESAELIALSGVSVLKKKSFTRRPRPTMLRGE